MPGRLKQRRITSLLAGKSKEEGQSEPEPSLHGKEEKED